MNLSKAHNEQALLVWAFFIVTKTLSLTNSSAPESERERERECGRVIESA
jgi:hypothetical protein